MAEKWQEIKGLNKRYDYDGPFWRANDEAFSVRREELGLRFSDSFTIHKITSFIL
jgi:hypothetical protein